MSKANRQIEVLKTPVKVKTIGQADFICLTDIAKSKNPVHSDDLIRNWLRNRNTLELLGIWEQLHNPDFNPVEFDGIRKQAGLNSFTLTPRSSSPGESRKPQCPLHQRRHGAARSAEKAQPHRHRADGNSHQRSQPQTTGRG